MVITSRVCKQMFQQSTTDTNVLELIRIPSTRQQLPQPLDSATEMPNSPYSRVPTFGAIWSPAEHERFLGGLAHFSSGPWKRVAEYVGSKTTRQVMTHAQKCCQKIARSSRGPTPSVQNKQATKYVTQFTFTAAVAATEEMSVWTSQHSPPKPELEPIVPLWDAAFGDLLLEPFDGSATLFYSEESSGDGISHLLFEEPGQISERLVGRQLVDMDSPMLLGAATSAPFSPPSVDETLALETPLSGCLMLEFEFVADEFTRVSHVDVRIWFGE